MGAVTIALISLLSEGRGEESRFLYPTGRLGTTTSLHYSEGIPILTVGGTPEEIGKGVGTLALKPASRITQYPRDLLTFHKANLLWGYFQGAGKNIYRNFPPDYKKELEAMAEASGANRDLLICGNTFFDLKSIFACSALVVDGKQSATKRPLLARNLDYPSLGYIHDYSLVTIYQPRGKLAFASVGFPGLVGVLSGMNEAGLCLAVLEVFSIRDGENHFNPRGVPYGICLRQILQESRTIAEAKANIEKMTRTTTINVAICDKESAGVLEVSPGKVELRPAINGRCVATNHFLSPALKPQKIANVNQSIERHGLLDKVETPMGGWTPTAMGQHLDQVNLGPQTLQTMAFDPASLKMYLAFGEPPASQHPFKVVELGKLFKNGKNMD